MRTRKAAYALPLAVVAALGCEKAPRDRLQGRWLGESVENVPEMQKAKAMGWVKGTAIEFAGSKVTVTIPAETPRTGTFRVTNVEGPRLTVSFLREEGGRDEARFRLGDERTLRWELGDGREIVMTKATN